jgi:glyoxylase-like metal-dependent hydrolase (beta-lactamase superfamily II)
MILESAPAFHALFTAEQMRATGVDAKIVLQPLRSGVTALFGSGANIAVLDGPEGKLMVDSGFAVSQAEITKSLSKISSQPIRHLVNTHWHFDHTDGNEWIQASGASIIAQAKTRLRMSQEQTIPEFQATFAPSPVAALPSILFEQSLEVRLNGENILIRRYTPAHTDTDASVYFEQADILLTGDTWFNEIYPFTDYNSGGSIDGMIAASAENLELAGPETLVIPGHGKIGTRNDLVEYHEMLLSVRLNVAALKAKGASLEAVLAAQPTKPFDARWGNGFIPSDLFLSFVYRGI